MKKNYSLLLFISVLFLALNSCGNKETNTSTSGINIPATTGLMQVYDGYDDHYGRKRITSNERRELGIDAIEEVKNYANSTIAKGKEIYKGKEGQITTFLVIEEDYATFEYLASYDPNGNVIDCIRAGANMAYYSDLGTAIIEGNRVKCLNSWGEPGEWGEGIDQIYTVTDNLYFVPFAWPPQSYPYEIPFMTYETSNDYDETDEQAKLYCTIESVVCTGKSGNQYTLVITGKSKQDCSKLKSADRTFMLEPLGKDAVSAGEAIKVVMPAVAENKTFEIKVKGLANGKVDDKIFTWLKVKRIEVKPLMDSSSVSDFDSEFRRTDIPVIGVIIDFFSNKIGEVALAWIVLILSVILFIMRISKKDDETRQGTSYIVSNTLFLSVCVLEIIHFIAIEDMIWFCVPDRVGWLWTIVNFFLLGGIVYNQILYLFDVIGDVFTNGKIGCDIRLGLYSWVGGIACALICGFFFQPGITWVLLLLGVLQLIQSIFIFRSFWPNLKGALFAVFVYLLGTIGTVLIAVTFISILIIVVLAIAVLWLVLKLVGGSDSKGGKARVDWSDGRSEEAEETGRGILGERYYRGKDTGREFQD